MQDDIDLSQEQGPINNPTGDIKQINVQFNDCTVFVTPDFPENSALPPPPTPSSSAPLPGPCPFICGPTVSPELFYGRQQQRIAIRDHIGGLAPGSVSIVGLRRIGKSSLLRYLKERISEFCPDWETIVVLLSFMDRRFHTPEGVNEGLRLGIERSTGRSPWNQQHAGDLWAIVKGLEEVRDSGYRLIVLIDEFEAIANHLEHFSEWGDDWRDKASLGYFSLVISSRRPLSEIYQQVGQNSPFHNIFLEARLGALEQQEWYQLVKDGFARSRGAVSELTQTHLDLIDELAGGLPLFVQIAASCLWRYGNDRDRIRADFADAVRVHFNDLWRGLEQHEKVALRALVTGRGAPDHATMCSLQQYGVVRRVGGRHEVFSKLFHVFVDDHLDL